MSHLLLCGMLIVVLVCVLYLRTTRYFKSHWRSQKVPSAAKDAVPVFGNLSSVFLLRNNFGTLLEHLYSTMGRSSMLGCYVMHTPALLIRDPELVKKVLHSDSFVNNVVSLHPGLDPILAENPFFAKDQNWRDNRALLAKNQSGRKLKGLLTLVDGVCHRLVQFVDLHITENQGKAELEAQLLFSRTIAEIIANASFGIDGQSFERELGKDAFIRIPDAVFNLDKLGGLQQVLRFFLPKFSNLLGISVAPKDVHRFIQRQLGEFIKSSVESGKNSDFLQFSVEDARAGVDENKLLAQATSLLFDGYEAIGNTLAFMFYRISENQEIQDKAREEVLRILESFDGQASFEALKQMSYLEQVVSEVLRMNPLFGDITRVCNADIELEGKDGLRCKLRPGDIAMVSASGMHFDPELWPEPEKFEPSRFDEKKHTGFTYFGFGYGARVCPGRRMGMAIVKAVAVAVLRKYRVEVSKKMTEKGCLRLNAKTFASNVEGGVWLRFAPL